MADQRKLSGAIRRNRTDQLQRLCSSRPRTNSDAGLFELYPEFELSSIDDESGKASSGNTSDLVLSSPGR